MTLFEHAAEKAFRHYQVIAASGGKGRVQEARRKLAEATVNGLKMALAKQ